MPVSDEIREKYFRRIQTLLRCRVGVENALTLDDICARCGIYRIKRDGTRVIDRRVGEMVLKDHWRLFGFTLVAGGHGFHRPQCAKEINDYRSNLKGRLREIRSKLDETDLNALEEGFLMEGDNFVDPPNLKQMDFLNPTENAHDEENKTERIAHHA